MATAREELTDGGEPSSAPRRAALAFRKRALVGLSVFVLVPVVALAAMLVHHGGVWQGRTGLPAVTAAITGPRVVALTIDDGPTATYTPQVLSLLYSHHVTATFFDIGQLAAAHPDLVRAVIAQGSAVGVHTWSHPKMNDIDDAQVRAEVLQGMLAIERITHSKPTLYRPPRGVMTEVEGRVVSGAGMRTVLWDQCLDHASDPTPVAAVERVLSHLMPGDIILLHDGAGRHDKTVQALAILLDELAARGYRVVPLDELPL
jgi:peptidoglycan-N-acetylglucosamine deacetylase